MERFCRYLSQAACCAILLLPLTFIAVGQAVAAPPTTNVNVVNTPSVNVVNTTLPVRDVDNPASQPLQAFASFNMAGGIYNSAPLFLAVVPSGKRLVIEFATVLAETGTGKMGAWVVTTIDGVDTPHWFVLTDQGPLYGVPAFTASQSMRVYADPGTQVRGFVIRSNDSTGTADGSISISGHLVDVP